MSMRPYPLQRTLIGLLLIILAGCGHSSGQNTGSAEQPLSPNMRIPLTALELQMACDDIASIVIVSMSNRISHKDVFATSQYARGLADTYDGEFKQLPPSVLLQVRKAYMKTVSQQSMASQGLITNQVDLFRTYGEQQFRKGTADFCKKTIANLPKDASIGLIEAKPD